MRQVPFGPVRFDVMQLKRKDRKTIDTIEDLQEELDNTLTSVSGNPITISDASNTNAEDFIVTIEPTQAGTGTPSPDNIRAITGLSSVDVVLNDNTITFSLGSTVYGGSVDLNTGLLTVDKAMVDLGDLTWTALGSDNKAFRGSLTGGTTTEFSEVADFVCSHYPVRSQSVGSTTYTDPFISGLNWTQAVVIWLLEASTPTDVKTSLDGVQLVYPLATPTTTQLTAQQLRLLQGENELSTTGSSMSFKYQRDNLIGELKAWVLDQLS